MTISNPVAETLVELLGGLRDRGDHTLLVCDDERLTYADAEHRSARLADALIALGAGKGTHVGVLYPNGADFVVAMLAVARVGAVVVPFSTFLTEAELRVQLLDSDVSIMLSARSFRSHDYVGSISRVRADAPCLRHVVFEIPAAGDPDLRHHMLGSTEAGSVVLLDPDDTDQPEHRRGSFGRPAPGFETKVLDSGELCIRGPYLMQGYYGRSREECFDTDGWFHTGDLVRVDDDGYFYFLGRAGAMIKTAGANVTPDEVQKALQHVLEGRDMRDVTVQVVGLPDQERGQVVAAVVATADPAAFDEAAVRAALRAQLSSYKVPRRFAVIHSDELPVKSSGKIDVAALRELFDD